MKTKMIFLLIFIFIISCTDDANEFPEKVTPERINPCCQNELYFPPVNSKEWKTISVSDLGWDVRAEKRLYNFLERKNTKAFIILKNGKIVVEKYFNNTTVSDYNQWYSVGKTLTAFTTGLAQQDRLLNINNTSATYLGQRWANISTDQERAIRVRDHLTMTSGLDYTVSNKNCTDFDCLTYRNKPGSFWYYHNAPYILLTDIISGAVNMDFTTYFETKLKNRIGMDGAWVSRGYANIFYSSARSMARFGLLNLNKGTWGKKQILKDKNYFTQMTSTSQRFNRSYGYLWWLNGKKSHRLPGLENEIYRTLIPEAPNDLIAGLGKNDQKLYIVPSQNLVIVRMGDSAGRTVLGPSNFDNELWKKIKALIN